ncbi:MAG: DUF86 domain-containing protein [Brevinematia bacterium]
MNKRNVEIYLKDIIQAMEAIENFVKGMDYEEFRNNDLVSSAVIRKFEIIGEATKNIPQELRKKYPDIPWKTMAGFRDKLIHFYFGIKYEIVWDTIKLNLPELKEKLRKIIEDLRGKNERGSKNN